MDDARRKLTQYLLGDLSETEQAAIEEAYFRDTERFDELRTAEAELVDAYVRDRLDAPTRRRFEEHFMADPRRRERVHFAQALATAADRTEPPPSADTAPSRERTLSWNAWFGLRPAWTAALVIVAIGATGVWFVSNRRVDEPAATSQAQQSTSRTPIVATLAVVIDPATRAQTAGPAGTVGLGADTDELRVNITLRDANYPAYRAILRMVGGAEIARRDEIARSGGGEQAFAIAVPAAQVAAADYMLTLQGRTAGGEFEDLSQTILRVTRP